jgi:5-methyltetrahydrofolate--homocysteine methyltransferase
MKKNVQEIIKQRILVLDGAMGTMIQRYKLTEEDYRGTRFLNHSASLKGNNDLLVLTKPEVIQEIHEKYLEAGADIIETNTFNAQRVSLSDYKMESLAYEMNFEAAKIAKKATSKYNNSEKPRFVAGSIGPTNKTASLSPDVNNPAARNVTYDELVVAYSEQIQGLMDGGVDAILIETIFDTLNAKAALYAVEEVFNEKNIRLPIMISVTITDNAGRTLSGQTLEAFLISISHADLFSIGLNCAFGAKQIEPYLEELSRKASFYVSVYPNAGLPNQFGAYDESAEEMAKTVSTFAKKGIVNIVGGCCGTTPQHINAIANAVKDYAPRIVPVFEPLTKLSGLESLIIREDSNFINIGERTNVSGSMKFAKLIRENKYEEALLVARQQIENGAQVFDVSLDDGMIDAETEMPLFLRWVSSDPDVAKAPIMIDSSKWSVLENSLKSVQGKVIVNSISLKEGEEQFLERAKKIRQYGAAAIIMAFDEEGQATTCQRKIDVCKKAYDLLTQKINFPPEDIIFDANILTIGTGLAEHNNFAIEFLDAIKWIKENLPYAKTSGGISNLSFAFRGNEAIRQVLHSVFLYHAIKAGLDMGIVNAGALPVYDQIDEKIKTLAEDLIFNKRPDATERILEAALNLKSELISDSSINEWRTLSVEERLGHALVKGIADFIDEDIAEMLTVLPQPIDIIEGPLMTGMSKVGELFGSGQMFLPQVMKSARVMKKAVALLQPLLEQQSLSANSSKAGKILIATVKGDVHDIGKNIAGIILSCNNYEIIDLGIMVPRETILNEAERLNVDMVGLSGLITPSLDEMIYVAKGMEERGMKIPLLIGGATTSKIHTAVKIAQAYSGAVVHVKDASLSAGIVSDLLNPERKEEYLKKLYSEYEELKTNHLKRVENKKEISEQDAFLNRFRFDVTKADIIKPAVIGVKVIKNISIKELIPLISWAYFFHQWQFKGAYPALLNDTEKGKEAKQLLLDAKNLLNRIAEEKLLSADAVIGIFPAYSEKNKVYFNSNENSIKEIEFPRNREPKDDSQPNLCLSDFIAPKELNITDYIGMFVTTAGIGAEKIEKQFKDAGDEYSALMVRILADRLAEALAEYLHEKIRKEIWAYSPNENVNIEEMLKEKYRGIRPAPGYPSCPEHKLKEIIFNELNVTENIGASLTESYSMMPAATVSGFYFAHPEARYFGT